MVKVCTYRLQNEVSSEDVHRQLVQICVRHAHPHLGYHPVGKLSTIVLPVKHGKETLYCAESTRSVEVQRAKDRRGSTPDRFLWFNLLVWTRNSWNSLGVDWSVDCGNLGELDRQWNQGPILRVQQTHRRADVPFLCCLLLQSNSKCCSFSLSQQSLTD